MNCPKCSIELKMSDRQGIEIDYCPTCRGVWLDRGELDKIIERSTSLTSEGYREENQPPRFDRRDRGYRSDEYDRGDYDRYGHKGRRKKSFFEELFD